MRHTREQQAELAALLAACKAEPDEPDRRHVLADWLEEHGAADVAECVRLSLAAEGLLADDPRGPGYAALLSDPRRPAGRWLAPLRAVFPHTTFHRGLLRVAATAREWLARRPEDVPAEHRPWLETLAVIGPREEGELVRVADVGWLRLFTALERVPRTEPSRDLFTSPRRRLAHLASLQLEWGYSANDAVGQVARHAADLPALRSLSMAGAGDTGLGPLSGSPLLRQLTSLDLSHTRTGPSAVAALCRGDGLRGLRRLWLDGNPLGAESLAWIGEGPGLAGLRSLSLVGCDLSVEDLRGLRDWPDDHPLEALSLWFNERAVGILAQLARWPGLSRVRWFKIDAPGVDDGGWAAFTRALRGGRLEMLQVNDAVVTDDAARLIADCPGLTNLRALCLQGGGITPEGLAALARSPHLQRLESLGLSNHRLGEAGYRALTTGSAKRGGDQSPFPRLHSLDLSRTLPARAGLDLLLRSPLMARLRFVQLRENRLGPAGARAIAAAPNVSNLAFLGLWTCSLKDEGAAALAGSPYLGGLRGLDLQKNNVGDEGALALAGSRSLGGLSWLSLRLNRVTDAGALALVNRPGGWGRLAVDHNPIGDEVRARAGGVSVLG